MQYHAKYLNIKFNSIIKLLHHVKLFYFLSYGPSVLNELWDTSAVVILFQTKQQWNQLFYSILVIIASSLKVKSLRKKSIFHVLSNSQIGCPASFAGAFSFTLDIINYYKSKIQFNRKSARMLLVQNKIWLTFTY